MGLGTQNDNELQRKRERPSSDPWRLWEENTTCRYDMPDGSKQKLEKKGNKSKVSTVLLSYEKNDQIINWKQFHQWFVFIERNEDFERRLKSTV